jgi:hypothetical protein
MTIETRTTVELSDINAVEFECRKCGTKTVRKIDGNYVTPVACDNCKEQWFLGLGPESGELGHFIERIGYYSGKGFPYLLRLQIAKESDEQRERRIARFTQQRILG